jgi:hypothetical protein
MIQYSIMSLGKLIPVYRESEEKAALMTTFLKGYQVEALMIPDVMSEPLNGPAGHGVKSQYSLHVVLVDEEYSEDAQALVDEYLAEEGSD